MNNLVVIQNATVLNGNSSKARARKSRISNDDESELLLKDDPEVIFYEVKKQVKFNFFYSKNNFTSGIKRLFRR